jgi:MFS family permease
VLAAAALVAARWTPDVPAEREEAEPPAFALPSRGVLAIGLVGLCAVVAEGSSMDWSGVYLRQDTGADPGAAAGAYTAFACTMAVARLGGDAVVRRFGPVRTVRAGGVLATAGGLGVVVAGSPWTAVTGFALIGVGIAVAVPLCFAAAGRLTASPGRSIAGVATLSYASGLAAPAAVGWIAQVSSLSVSFAVVTVLSAGLVLGAGVLRTRPAVRRAEGVRPGQDRAAV